MVQANIKRFSTSLIESHGGTLYTIANDGPGSVPVTLLGHEVAEVRLVQKLCSSLRKNPELQHVSEDSRLHLLLSPIPEKPFSAFRGGRADSQRRTVSTVFLGQLGRTYSSTMTNETA